MLYQLLVSLPFLDDVEELDLKLKEVQKIKWGSQQVALENLRAYLKALSSDQHLWCLAYRMTPKVPVNDPKRKLQVPIFTGDLSIA